MNEREPIGIGAGREKTLRAIENKDRLGAIDSPDSIRVVTETVNEIAVSGVRSPPREVVERIETVYNSLPDNARSEFIADEVLLRRINTARRQFNEWMGKRRRMAEMPSPMEAGRSKYPTTRAQKLSRCEQDSSDELDRKITRIKSAVGGAKQRALTAVGSSVAEHSQQQRDRRQEAHREAIAEGSIVQFRNPNLRVGRFVRVNQKSVRVRYRNPRAGASCPITGEEEPDEIEDRIQLDSEYLALLDVETIERGEEVIDNRDGSQSDE
jgi:hypothetical protein